MLGGIAGEVLGGIAAFHRHARRALGRGGGPLEASIHRGNISIAEYQAAQAVTNPEVEQRLGRQPLRAPTCPLGVLPLPGGLARRHHRHPRPVAGLLRDWWASTTSPTIHRW
jgi:hypothetical protein